MFKKSLGSDNHSGVHPQIFNALMEVNQSHAPSYGTDEITQKAEALFAQHFGEQAKTFFVFNGTAANVLSLKSCLRSHHSVICTDVAHLNVDECGAPENHVGCKLLPLPSQNGKLSAGQISAQMIRLGDQHYSQPKMVSLTQPTELGTVYELDEFKVLCQEAKDCGLYIHVDGARLIYAAYVLNKTFKEITTDLGVDVVSFGGTKNGLLFGEAVVLINPDCQADFKFLRKQAMQLPSKMRFMAAQFIEFLGPKSLWHEIAEHGHQMATYLKNQLESIDEVKVVYPVQANAVFAQIPEKWTKALRQEAFFYVWDEIDWVMRWMCSFDTQKEDLDRFVAKIHNARENL